ncbi:hypothetical protein CAI16_02945 [Virgibacillus dokdonensis]|uniref:Terminase n=1 Tax=Virgibacillus dokdonensis TaxID=302167 RepID=A0A3E0WYD5_9BACI|nr:phage terminase small subunit [Virgibacillus dokdonensis]RFA37046.1 hypothetical protein CAI16_02945 [Virgibacillus dokdonensis]
MPNWKEIRREWETTKITLAALADKHDVKLGTLKSRKSREKWSRDPTKKVATKTEKVATPKKKQRYKLGSRKGAGNPNPENQFTERNSAALKHGLFSKYIPQETLDIIGMMDNNPADLIWDQIKIQYAAIIRAQQIMFVENRDDTVKELKKLKVETVQGPDGEIQVPTEKEYEIQFAWDRYANFLNAQSRAMSEFRSLIKQFNEIAYEDDVRRLQLEQMQLNIYKTKAEIDRLTDDGDDDAPFEIVITRKGDGL